MRKTVFALFISGLCMVALPAQASAIDLSGGLLVGSGIDTGDSANNPYRLQLGGFAELSINSWVLGFKATRSLSENADCGVSGCVVVDDLRSMGGDLGWEWDVLLLHIGPRLGIGQVREVDAGRKAVYFDPGAVLDLEVGWFMAGLDVRYRFAVNESDLNGLMVLARLGLRF